MSNSHKSFPKPKHYNSDPVQTKVDKDSTFYVSKVALRNVVNDLKFLVCRAMFENKSPCKSETIILIEHLNKLEERMEHDILIARKYRKLYEFFGCFLRFHLRGTFTCPESYRVLEKLTVFYAIQRFLTPNSYFGNLRRKGLTARLKRQNRKLLDGRLYDSAYIGVGYNDKGNKKDTAVDGSPSWQEVAATNDKEDELINFSKEEGVLFLPSHYQRGHLDPSRIIQYITPLLFQIPVRFL